MTIADFVFERVRQLPEPLAREVLDFVGFLQERQKRKEWRDLMNVQAAGLASTWANTEDDVWNHA
jgi:hypothetical protein